MKKPQAIFFDIDGTLVSFKTHSIPVSAKTAIQQLKNEGIKVIISTGRAYRDIDNLEGLEFDGYITSNGACCIDSKGKIIALHPLSKESLGRLALSLEERPFPCTFMTVEGNFINCVDHQVRSVYQQVNLLPPPVQSVSETIRHDVLQLSAFLDLEREADLLKHVLTDCVGSRWHPVFVDFNMKNISKATGMDRFLEYFNIESDCTMAFGDGGNDISILKHAAIGVAMQNANDNVKAAADYVTDSVDEDGIFNALKYFDILS
jgi:Cof subfamily protein (haloacid dehalogenase superfamily)